MKLMNLYIFVALIAITGYSCKQKGGKYMSEGEIHYNIEYTGEAGAIPTELMPQELVVYFKNDKILFEMVSPFGNSGIMNLTNPEKKIYDTYFSLFTIKYYYAAAEGEAFPGFEAMESLKITKTDKTTIICGLNCKNAEVIFPGKNQNVYNIWYTNELEVENPNASTPLSELDGVLMNFTFLMGSTILSFNAETIYELEIPDKQFERREEYQLVTKAGIKEFINKMSL